MKRLGLILFFVACAPIDVPLVVVPDAGAVCRTNEDCGAVDLFCAKTVHTCTGFGFCEKKLPLRCASSANLAFEPVCGCDGVTYFNGCWSASQGVAVDSLDECHPPGGNRCLDHCAPPAVCGRVSCETGPDLCLFAPASCPDVPARTCRAPQCIDLCAALTTHQPGPFEVGCL